MADVKPYIDEDGEVRELDEHFFRNARPGRPPMPSEARKQRVNLTLDPDVVAQLRKDGDMSGRVNRLLRRELALDT